MIPIYLEMFQLSEWFKQQFSRHCLVDAGQIRINFVHQIEADLIYSTARSNISFNQGDLIVMCLMEEEITVSERFIVEDEYCSTDRLETIAAYEVMSYDRDDRLPVLRGRQMKVLTTGSYDIGENFQRLVETQLIDRLPVIVSRAGMSAVKIIDELAKVR